MKPYIITIARQYGSGGKTVGKMLAERLGIPFYNREIITMASEDSGVNAMLFSDERLKSDFIARLHARYRGDIPVPNDSSKSYLRDEALFSYLDPKHGDNGRSQISGSSRAGKNSPWLSERGILLDQNSET